MLQLTLDFFGRQLDRFKPVLLPRPTRRRIEHTLAWKHGLKVHVLFPPRARRYLLSLRPEGAARLVIPRRGTEAEGLRFLERSEPWLLKQLAKERNRSRVPESWADGARFLFRGEEVVLRIEKADEKFRLRFADEIVSVPHEMPDYREAVQRHLRQMAERELAVRTRELALVHGITVRRLTIRAQKTRWGSCSARGTISLNWRLIQAPSFVVDYLIIHELMHRREMNHSARYWKLVEKACPDYRQAELWLKKGGIELRG